MSRVKVRRKPGYKGRSVSSPPSWWATVEVAPGKTETLGPFSSYEAAEEAGGYAADGTVHMF